MVLLPHLGHCELRGAQNHREQVVEVVRNAPREAAYGFQSLREAKLLFEAFAFRLGPLSLHPQALSLERALDSGSQPFHVLLDDVVPRPGLHALDRRVFVHRARDHDEGHVWATLQRELERGQAIELGHLEIGNDEPGAKVI